MCSVSSFRTAFIAVFILTVINHSVFANTVTSPAPAKQITLGVVAREISMQSGIQFKFNADVEQDATNVTASASDDWKVVVGKLLKDYNYSLVTQGQRIQSVMITGRSNHNSATATTSIDTSEAPQISVRMPKADLLNMGAGNQMILNLPVGEFVVTRESEADASSDWVAWNGKSSISSLEGEYQMALVYSQGNLVGNIRTPNGSYTLVDSKGATRLVAVNDASLNDY